MPYTNSASKSMNTDDYGEATIRVRKVSFTTKDQQEVKTSKKLSTSSQVETLENSQNSLKKNSTAGIFRSNRKLCTTLPSTF